MLLCYPFLATAVYSKPYFKSDRLLGLATGSSGTYELSGAGVLSSKFENIGVSGTGSFTQSGGTNTVTNTLVIACNDGSSGAYVLNGGLLTAGTITLNTGGTFTRNGGTLTTAVFNQNGGTVSGVLQNNGTFNYNSGLFNGRLINNGTANFNADFTAGNGMEHYTDLTLAAGRTVTLNGFGLANEGTITLSGGTLSGNGTLVNNNFITGYGTIAGSGGFVNNAAFAQSGGNLVLANSGVNANYGNMDLELSRQLKLDGSTLTNAGSFNLNGAVVTGTGTLVNTYGGTIAGRGTIAGNFDNAGGLLLVESGTTNITKGFSNSGLIQMAGNSANLVGGSINNTGKIEGYGNIGNNIGNTGTVQAQNGTLNLSGVVNNNVGGRMTAGTGSEIFVARGLAVNAGIINLTGGAFDNNGKAMTNTGQISGYGVLSTGGLSNAGKVVLTGTNGSTTTVNGNITNETPGKIEVAYNPAIFTGNVTNYGTFKSTETTVKFTGSYTEHGTFLSDPATNYFDNVIIGADGAWVGGVGDSFNIYHDIINNSIRNLDWNTTNAMLSFIGSGSHNYALAGADLGAVMSGYANNFAWGVLNVEGDIYLSDGNTLTIGGAQYVSEIMGAVIDGTGSGITNIHGIDGLNIYYLASLADNSYLHGQIYDLAGGGHLIPVNTSNPIPTPEPPAFYLLGIGLAGLIKFRKGRLIG